MMLQRGLNIGEHQPTEKKSWGHYTDILRKDGMVVKGLSIYPGQKISNQKHFERKETWIVLFGTGEVILEDFTHKSLINLKLEPGTKFIVDYQVWHQVKADDNSMLIILEIQEGINCNEQDIIRKEDVL